MYRDGDDSWDSSLNGEFGSVDRSWWDEGDWEQFLLRQDALNAKYQELYETLRDHPSRDELIAREMRWHLPEDVFAGFPDDDDDEPIEDEEWQAREEAFAADLEAIAAYRLGQAFAERVDHCLAGLLGERVTLDEDAVRTVRAAFEVAHHIANGHSIGYERDTLCGNIACCARARRSLDECFDGLLVLRRRGVVPPSHTDRLLAVGRDASDAIAQRTEELRRQVWWA
jgi:hypothetical protein